MFIFLFFVSDSPILSLHHGYLHQPGNVSLELICTVQAFPRASVKWLREDRKDISMEITRVEETGEDRHVLLIHRPTKVLGKYFEK